MEKTAGIDLASEEHRLCVVDGEGRQLEQRRVVHDEDGMDALCGRPLSCQRTSKTKGKVEP